MELIHADKSRREIGVIQDFNMFDAEISGKRESREPENSWQLQMGIGTWKAHPIKIGDYIYINNSEWGGMVEKIIHNTSANTIVIAGVTWRGILARKVIMPPTGKSHFVFTGDAGKLIEMLVPNELFYTVSGGELSVSFRYANLLGGLQGQLADAGMALDCRYDNIRRMVRIGARSIIDYTGMIDLSQDYGVDIVTSEGGLTNYNHVVALGRGELQDRTIVELYRLDDGTIVDTPPSWHGTLYDRVMTYDYSSVETTQELIKMATAKLKEQSQKISLEMEAADIPMNIGDIVGARDRETGIYASASVTGMILKMSSNGLTIEKRVG